MLSKINTYQLLLKLTLLVAILFVGTSLASIAGEQNSGSGGSHGSSGATGGSSEDSNEGTAWTIRKNYFKRYKWAKKFGPTTQGGHDDIEDGESKGDNAKVKPKSGPVFKWPKKIEQGEDSKVPTKRDEGIQEFEVKTFGYPVSDTQFQIIQRLDDNMMLEEAFDPERWMWMETAMGAIKANSAANSVSNLGRNQALGAIEFAKNFLDNFTIDSSNVWNRIRNGLFIPMAIALLLPGAVLSQVRAIVAQGTSILGDVNPFDGIVRSIIAIFLIPATYLVVNYGIDVSNAIAKSIKDGYQTVFHSDMFSDASCAQKRAFPIRKLTENKNSISTNSSNTNPSSAGGGNDPFKQLESISFKITDEDQCSEGQGDQSHSGLTGRKGLAKGILGIGGQGKGSSVGGEGGHGYPGGEQKYPGGAQRYPGEGGESNTPVAGTFESVMGALNKFGGGQNSTAISGLSSGLSNGGGIPFLNSQAANSSQKPGDEEDPVLKSTQRLLVGGANAGLTATWNVLCAFQMAYLYYLFCIGPVVAALWVWPMAQLRSAFPSWVEGVVTLCFWSLFWNTTILLMAAFKGVGETGTIIVTALNFLANSCVKYAFDFAGLVKAAGEQAGKEATKGAHGGQRGAGAGHGAHGAAAGSHGAAVGGHSAGGSAGSGAHGATTAVGGASTSHSEVGGATSSAPGLMPGGHGGGSGGKGLGAGHTLPTSGGNVADAQSSGVGGGSSGGEGPPSAGMGFAGAGSAAGAAMTPPPLGSHGGDTGHSGGTASGAGGFSAGMADLAGSGASAGQVGAGIAFGGAGGAMDGAGSGILSAGMPPSSLEGSIGAGGVGGISSDAPGGGAIGKFDSAVSGGSFGDMTGSTAGLSTSTAGGGITLSGSTAPGSVLGAALPDSSNSWGPGVNSMIPGSVASNMDSSLSTPPMSSSAAQGPGSIGGGSPADVGPPPGQTYGTSFDSAGALATNSGYDTNALTSGQGSYTAYGQADSMDQSIGQGPMTGGVSDSATVYSDSANSVVSSVGDQATYYSPSNSDNAAYVLPSTAGSPLNDSAWSAPFPAPAPSYDVSYPTAGLPASTPSYESGASGSSQSAAPVSAQAGSLEPRHESIPTFNKDVTLPKRAEGAAAGGLLGSALGKAATSRYGAEGPPGSLKPGSPEARHVQGSLQDQMKPPQSGGRQGKRQTSERKATSERKKTVERRKTGEQRRTTKERKKFDPPS